MSEITNAIEAANCALSFGNLGLLVFAFIAKMGEIEWKQIAIRRGSVIERNEREVRELKNQNERLNKLVDVLRKTEDDSY